MKELVGVISKKKMGPIETHSLPTLTRSFPRRFTFYVAHPTRSIHHRREIRVRSKLLAFAQPSKAEPDVSAADLNF